MCEVDWPLILEFVKVVPPVLIAIVVGWIAYQQWRTAKDKLALDLFDRRFAAHRALVHSIKTWSQEPYRPSSPNEIIRGNSPTFTQLNREMAEARFLFGEDVIDQLRATVEILLTLERQKDAIHEIPADAPADGGGSKMAQAVIKTLHKLTVAQRELDHRVERYMMLDRISVGKPTKRRADTANESEFARLVGLIEDEESKSS